MVKIKLSLFIVVVVTISLCVFSTCKYDKGVPDYNNYPADIGKIMVTKCAVAGCHNEKSKNAAGGLSLFSWEKMFEGGTTSACVIPFRADFSTTCYYVNTYTDLGVILTPAMPLNNTHLSHQDVKTIQDWVNAGAPDENGFVKFSDYPARKKYYVINQGCDVVTVFDAATLLPMRFVDIGQSGAMEAPHEIEVSPDGQYWYVVFLNNNYIEKYRTTDDTFVGKVYIGPGAWNTMAISTDSHFAYCIDYSNNGNITTVDLNAMTATIQGGFSFGHGSVLNNTNDILYVTQNTNSSKIFKIPVADFSAYSEVNLYTSTPPSIGLNTHDVKFTPDGSKYFVTCQGTNEVRIMQTSNDSLLQVIAVGDVPSEVRFSTSTHYAFVTCIDDEVNSPAGGRGSVAVLDYVNNTLVKFIYTGYQPHGLEVDDEAKLVIVANANFSNTGPPPHHPSKCGGRNGYVSFIDLNTLTMVTQPNSSTVKKVEVSVYPYSVSIRY